MTPEVPPHLAKRDEPFFVGYLNKVPKGLGGFLALVMLSFIVGMGAAAFSLSSSIQDPGDGTFRFNLGRQERIGRLEYLPYPVLRVPASEDGPARAFLLSGFGKRGVIERGRDFEDLMVRTEGILIERGDIAMMQLVGARRGLAPADDMDDAGVPDYYPPEPIKLGTWRLTGEICDGKCYVGAMRPGRGLAHKACANLCLHDGIPPVFVSTGPVDGETFFLLADKDGNILGDEISPITALMLEAEGEVERVDDLLIFKMDMESVRVRR